MGVFTATNRRHILQIDAYSCGAVALLLIERLLADNDLTAPACIDEYRSLLASRIMTSITHFPEKCHMCNMNAAHNSIRCSNCMRICHQDCLTEGEKCLLCKALQKQSGHREMLIDDNMTEFCDISITESTSYDTAITAENTAAGPTYKTDAGTAANTAAGPSYKIDAGTVDNTTAGTSANTAADAAKNTAAAPADNTTEGTPANTAADAANNTAAGTTDDTAEGTSANTAADAATNTAAAPADNTTAGTTENTAADPADNTAADTAADTAANTAACTTDNTAASTPAETAADTAKHTTAGLNDDTAAAKADNTTVGTADSTAAGIAYNTAAGTTGNTTTGPENTAEGFVDNAAAATTETTILIPTQIVDEFRHTQGDFLAVRNDTGDFFMCQLLDPILDVDKKVQVMWYQQKNDLYVEEYTDAIFKHSVLTKCKINAVKGGFRIPDKELKRIMGLLEESKDGICSDILTRLQKEDVVLAEVPTVRPKTVFFFAVVKDIKKDEVLLVYLEPQSRRGKAKYSINKDDISWENRSIIHRKMAFISKRNEYFINF